MPFAMRAVNLLRWVTSLLMLALLCLPAQAAPALLVSSQGAPGIDPTGRADSTAGLNALLSGLPPGGGTVQVRPGTYRLGAPLVIHSNTALRCEAGATFKPVGQWRAPQQVLRNRGSAGGSGMDENISVTGCGFDLGELRKHGEGYFAMYFGWARHVLVDSITCRSGGDCVAMVATDGTTIQNSTATGIRNACWDHWNAPWNGKVIGGYCSTGGPHCSTGADSPGSGVFITAVPAPGMPLSPNGNGKIVANFVIEGGVYDICGGGSGMWIMGLAGPGDGVGAANAAGYGARNVRVTAPVLDLHGLGRPCVKVSGNISGVTLDRFTCKNGPGSGVVVLADNGGAPSQIAVSHGTLDGFGGQGAILFNIGGRVTGTVIEDNTVINSHGFAYGVHLGGSGNVARRNRIPGGSQGLYLLDGPPGQNVAE